VREELNAVDKKTGKKSVSTQERRGNGGMILQGISRGLSLGEKGTCLKKGPSILWAFNYFFEGEFRRKRERGRAKELGKKKRI